MLRPSFKKYFHDDNFSDSPTLQDETELGAEAEVEPSLLEKDGGDVKDGLLKKSTILKSQNDDPNWISDRSVYEIQLNQLQEQLVETMLENQQLGW